MTEEEQLIAFEALALQLGRRGFHLDHDLVVLMEKVWTAHPGLRYGGTREADRALKSHAGAAIPGGGVAS